MQEIDLDNSNVNKYNASKENDTEDALVSEGQNGEVEECTEKRHTIPLQDDVPQTKLCAIDFPIPVPEMKFPARLRMPRMPRMFKQKNTTFGCDGETMDMRRFDHLLNRDYKKSCCQDGCCNDEQNTRDLVELSISSDTQTEPINSIPQ